MAAPRYLIGQGERLSEDIPRPGRGSGDKAHPYSFIEARKRLTPQWTAARNHLHQLPELACPDGQATLEVMLHPSYLAKSYYPAHFVKALGLRHLGSRAVHLVPQKVVGKRAEDSGKAQPAPVLYLSGDRDDLLKFSENAATWAPNSEDVESAYRQIEQLGLPGPDRLKTISNRFDDRDRLPLEVVLHTPDDDEFEVDVIGGFSRYLKSIGAAYVRDKVRQVGGLSFVPVLAPPDVLSNLLSFTFLRAVREAPRVIPFDPVTRSFGASFPINLTAEPASAQDLSTAIFDGGLPDNHGLERWVTLRDAPGVSSPVASGQAHGLKVTSAFLFGPLAQGVPVDRPHANVDHWRVYGEDDLSGDFEAVEILDRIENILSSRRYDFINVSLGPDYAIDDDDVSPWTSRLDQILSGGETVATIACGNNGDLIGPGLNRVQPPSDGVNMLAVGASDCFTQHSKRAEYSAIGPGRSPGYVKPDFLTFGGSHGRPFLALSEVTPHAASGTMGTSFAAPLAMRCGAGVRAQFSDALWAPAVKALLVHQADLGDHHKHEAGWGMLSHGLGDLVLCNDYEAHIVYQRQMPLTGSVRLYLPVPDGLTGFVDIKATFSFFCDVDPEDAINYTRGGLDIQFRPDTTTIPLPYKKGEKTITPTVPASESFFSAKNFYATEHMSRDDAQKWETTLSAEKRKTAKLLKQPAFDVSYIAREHGHNGRRPANMKFALVLTLRNAKAKDLYDRVIVSSGNRLQAMKPRVGVTIPVRLQR